MTKRALIGILIDFSHSMRWNWANSGGEDLPKVQSIHDTLVEKLRDINLKGQSNGIDYSKLEVFCLGSGFVRPVYYNAVEFSYREEKVKDETMTKSRQVDIVCDLLSLLDIIPNQEDIEKIKVELNKKWNEYATEIINSVQVYDDVYELLSAFIKSSLQETATRKFEKTIRKRVLTILRQVNLPGIKMLTMWREELDKYEHNRRELIEQVSTEESDRQVEKVASKSSEIVASRKEDFSGYISQALNQFLSDQSIIILDLLTVTRDYKIVLDHFDQEQLKIISQDIYTHLKREVDKAIGVYWKLTLTVPKTEQARIGATLDIAQLQRLVEDCMKKDIWKELRPFVEEVIQNLFASIFVAQVRERIPYWIGLASTRDVVKPISKMSLLIPKTSDIDLYSDEYMYGINPIKEALDKCAIRFTNKDHSRKIKMLVLFSDGEFENTNPLFDPRRVADVIKKSGVRIICFYVGDKDVTKKGSTALINRAPHGAVTMHNMSSNFDVQESLEKEIIKKRLALPQSQKLFFQINKSDTLKEFLQVIFVDSHTDK